MQAGAISLVQLPSGELKYSRVKPEEQYVVDKAIQKLSGAVDGIALDKENEAENQEWFVSAPGKVILFGEHAVVHGVVSSPAMYPPLV